MLVPLVRLVVLLTLRDGAALTYGVASMAKAVAASERMDKLAWVPMGKFAKVAATVVSLTVASVLKAIRELAKTYVAVLVLMPIRRLAATLALTVTTKCAVVKVVVRCRALI